MDAVKMDHRIKSSRELSYNLAHIQSIISSCKTCMIKIKISPDDQEEIIIRIERAIRDLSAIKREAEVQRIEMFVQEEDIKHGTTCIK